jgi:DNA-binding transcriptional LysR family regulator
MLQLCTRQLNGFIEISKTQNFHKAAERLFITQSALSQRIRNLEKDIGSILLVRNRANVFLTESGKKLLAYCNLMSSLESDYLNEIQNNDEIKTEIRITTFSSLLRSIIIPMFEPLIKEHPGILLEWKWDEMFLLKRYIKEGKSDFVIADYEFNLHGVTCELLGYEENVMIAAKNLKDEKGRSDVFLDHDADDDMTKRFFQHNNITKKVRRSYLGDVYGLIDGVKHGLGRAIVSRHLLNLKEVQIIKKYKPLLTPVYLHYNTESFYSKSQKLIIATLLRESKHYLKQN